MFLAVYMMLQLTKPSTRTPKSACAILGAGYGCRYAKKYNMKTGRHGEFYWLVSNEEIRDIDKIVIEYRTVYTLYLATFDSGPLLPTQEELKQGWKVKGEIMVSPPLSDTVTIPYEQYDEWYISKGELTFPRDLERYVNYGGFRLYVMNDDSRIIEPTWERSNGDHMRLHQDAFWKQLLFINPETFVAIGDNEIVVSKDERLINHIAAIA